MIVSEGLLCVAMWCLLLFWGGLIALGFENLVPSKWILYLRPSLRFSLRLWFPVVLLFAFLFWIRSDLYPVAQRASEPWGYYSSHFLLLRMILDFLVWGALALVVRSGVRRVGPAILILVLFSGTQFTTDWLMALQPQFKSTAFGLIVLVSALVLAMGVAILKIRDFIPERQMLDIGNVHFALVATWTYLNLMQFLVIWSGNLPGDSIWFVVRLRTSWKVLCFTIVILQVVVPLLLLPFRKVRGEIRAARWVAALSVAGQSLFLFVLVVPNWHSDAGSVGLPLLLFMVLILSFVCFYPRSTKYASS